MSTPETVGVRIVRTVQTAHPRALGAADIMGTLDGVGSGTVMAELNRLSQERMPLSKERVQERLQYSLRPDFDVDGWIRDRKPARARPAVSDEAIQAVRIVHASRTPVTSAEVYDGGNFLRRDTMLLAMQRLCEDGEPLERSRQDAGSPWRYHIRAGFDVDGWLAERADGAAPAETKAAAPQVPAAVRPGTDPPPSATPPARAAAPAPEPATPPATLRAAPSKEGAEPARAAATVQQTAGVKVPAIAASAHTERPVAPAAPAERKRHDPIDIATDLAIIAAANLAAVVRECDIDSLPDLKRALNLFERADRAREDAKAVRT